MVYLFCDDTAFVASNPAMMDLLIGCYKTFTIRWRIRVNPGISVRLCTVTRHKLQTLVLTYLKAL